MKIMRHIVVLGIAAFFAVMWGALLRERLPELFIRRVPPSYDRLLEGEQDEREVVMGFYRGDSRVGEVRSRISRREGYVEIENNTQISFGGLLKYFAPDVDSLEARFVAEVSEGSGLQSFSLRSKQLDLMVQGTVRGEELQLTGAMGGQKIDEHLPYDREVFVGDMLSPTTGIADLEQVSPGETWTIRFVNPIAGGVQPVEVQLVASERFEVGEQQMDVYHLAFRAGTGSWSAFVTGGGEVLVQGTPFGLILRREDLSPAMEPVVEELSTLVSTGE
ncbi:MAG: hypothetical protein ACOCSQ_01465 [Planctomycetota bacterium]